MLAHGIARGAGIGKPRRKTRRIRSSERCDTSSGPFCELPFRTRRVRGRFTAPLRPRVGPLDHVDMSAVDALKQQNRGESVVEPGQLPGELHARRATTTDQPRLWLVIHVWIIGVRECRHGTGNIVRRASVEATSVVGDRARVRWFRRIRSLRISGRPAQTAAALAGACGKPHRIPALGAQGCRPGFSEQASNQVSMTDIACNQCGEHFRPRRSTGQYCSPSAEKLVLGPDL